MPSPPNTHREEAPINLTRKSKQLLIKSPRSSDALWQAVPKCSLSLGFCCKHLERLKDLRIHEG